MKTCENGHQTMFYRDCPECRAIAHPVKPARRPLEAPGTRTAAHPAPWDAKARHRALLRAVDRGLEVKA